MESLSSTIQKLMITHKDFSQKLMQHLVLQSPNVTNPFKFIVQLVTEGVLCDGLSDPGTTFGLKEMIVQLAITIACSKGADAIGGLMKALRGSGNSQLISALNTWIKQDFGIQADCGMIDSKKATAAVRTHKPKSKSKTKVNNSSGIELLQKVMSERDQELMEQLEGHLVAKAANVLNAPQMCSHLFRENLLDERDFELKTSTKAQRRQWAEKAMKAACSKGAFGPLVVALQCSGNERILQETLELLENLSARKNKDPMAIKSLANQQNQEESKIVRSTFFDQSALPDELSKLATFHTLQKTAEKGTLSVQFDRKRMIALSSDCTLTLWNWQGGDEEPMEIALKAKQVTCFQYDQEILVLGTAEGVVYLFDSRTFEEKWSVRLGEAVASLEFVESTLGVITPSYDRVNLWWMEISRPEMRLLNRGPLSYCKGPKNQIERVCMHPDTTFFYSINVVYVFETKSGKRMQDDKKQPCSLSAPSFISSLIVGDLISTKKVVVAGCIDGTIAMWNTSKFVHDQSPVKAFPGHCETIVSVRFLNGHVLSLDASGKLLMWSGYDLVTPNVMPVPRVLVQTSNVTNLDTHARWFASCSLTNDIINVWTLPDMWLRTG